MKCSNCGAELSDDTKFCSYCGKKIEETVSASSTAQKMQNLFESMANESKKVNVEKTNDKKSMADKVKQKGVDAWNTLSIYGKITTIAITVFVFLCIIAFLFGKTFAAIITILQIVLTVIALLMKKQIIKVPKNWLYIIALTFAIILLIPYVYLFKSDYENIKRFKWSDVVLSDTVPKTKSRSGEILINSMDHLSLDVYGISQNQYDDYIENCKEMGFIVDAEQLETTFTAYNDSGYKLSLYYYTSDSTMHIGLDAAYQYGTIVWSDDGLATMIPVPKSAVGEISKDDENGFLAYVANTPIDDFNSYIALCVEKGFIVDSHNSEKVYSAKNSEGYRLSVEYQGNNVICIAVDEPEYEVTIKVEFVANLIFSKYDVDFFIDDDKQDILKHGNDWEKTLKLEKGEHIIKFVSTEDSSICGEATISIASKTEAAYKISCYADKVTVDMLYLNMDVDLAENEVKILCSESDFSGKNYKDVENELIAAGFINVKTVPIYDVYFGITDVESVDDVSISGSDDFKRGDIFLNDVEIVITYHMSYEDDPEYQPADDIENELPENELIEDESEEDELDFSWIEDAIANNQDTDYDAEVLDENDAWRAVADYGKMKYSKFELHYYAGKLNAEQVDDNAWNLKAYCDVDDGNGTKKNLNCEATVEGTNLDPVVTYFKVY